MVIADQAYEANDFIQMIQDMGAMVVIPVRSNRNQQREYDYHWYKDRNLVVRFFNKIKQFRRIARLYEKLDRNFMSMLNLVCTIICLAWILTGPRLVFFTRQIDACWYRCIVEAAKYQWAIKSPLLDGNG